MLQNEKGEIYDAYSNIGPVSVLTLKDHELLKKAIALTVGTEVQRNLLPLTGPGSVAR